MSIQKKKNDELVTEDIPNVLSWFGTNPVEEALALEGFTMTEMLRTHISLFREAASENDYAGANAQAKSIREIVNQAAERAQIIGKKTIVRNHSTGEVTETTEAKVTTQILKDLKYDKHSDFTHRLEPNDQV